mgnify:CR=1 FL=1
MRVYPVPIGEVRENRSVFQSPLWGRFKENRGHPVGTFRVESGGKDFPILIVYRPFAEGTLAAYLPYGPEAEVSESEQGPFLEELAEVIRPYLLEDCSFIRFDLPWANPFQEADRFDENGMWRGPPEARVREMRMNFGSGRWNLFKAPTDLKPTDSVVVDLKRTDGEILGDMKSKTRYNIRLAGRRGVEVSVTAEEGLEEWHRLHRETAERKGITEESLEYFDDLFRTESSRGSIRLLRAHRSGRLLAAAVIALYKERAYYLYGASSSRERRNMAPYALQWRGITYAREWGCRSYDLYGIPPSNDPSHPLWGLYRFKTGFGGRILHYRGCWDYPYDRELYKRHAGARGMVNPYHR